MTLKERSCTIDSLLRERSIMQSQWPNIGPLSLREQDTLLEETRLQFETIKVVAARLKAENMELNKLVSKPDCCSAKIVASEPLVLGVEADDENFFGVKTQEYIDTLNAFRCSEAYCLGRIRLVNDSGMVPVCVRSTLVNDGTAPWPSTTAIVHVSGESLGCPLITVGAARPGEQVDLCMDLSVQADRVAGFSSSAWAVVNA